MRSSSRQARQSERPPSSRAEKSFYLDEFRAHTVCFSARLGKVGDLDQVAAVAADLIANGTRIVLVLGENPKQPTSKTAVQNLLRDRLSEPATVGLLPVRRGRASLAGVVTRLDPKEHGGQLATLWSALRTSPIFVALVPEGKLLDMSRWITAQLRIQKWVILDPRGGLNAANGTPISFMDDSMLTEVLRAGAAEWAGLAGRLKTLGAVRDALREGVQAVNLCTDDQLATELFTYEGAGTLFTLEDYCRIERLGIDDFEEVERLLERGQREGFLKERDHGEVAAILLNGFGATIGANHLAGVCGLLTEPYKRSKAGEIAGLYTITRFKSEGVGSRLLRHALGHARSIGLRYVFACTTDNRAAEFFKRQGFRQVGKSGVPSTKWKGYRLDRQRRVTILRHDLS